MAVLTLTTSTSTSTTYLKADLEDIFEQLFNQSYGGTSTRTRRIVRKAVDISLQEAFLGVKKDIYINEIDKTISIDIPAGIENGQGMRVEEQNNIFY